MNTPTRKGLKNYSISSNERTEGYDVNKAPLITIITTCKGRRSHLAQTLPTMLRQCFNGDYEILVVDYGDPDGTYKWVGDLGDPRLRGIRILDGTAYFNLSRARNCGASLSSADVLCFVDADMLLGEDWIARMTGPILRKEAVLVYPTGERKTHGMGGSIAVERKAWQEVRGYDEAFNSWGPERKDFELRIAKVGSLVGIENFDAHIIDHDDLIRMEFYPIANRLESMKRGHKLMKKERRAINPNGFGVARVQCGRYIHCIADGRIVRTEDLNIQTDSMKRP